MKNILTGLISIAGILGGYIFLIMPRLSKQKETKRFKGSYYAHRGLHNLENGIPENSLLAFRKALEAGYGMELDVQVTRDGELIVFHDETLERVCGIPKKIADCTCAELENYFLLETQEKIPRLAEVLELVEGKVPLIIDSFIDIADTSIAAVLNLGSVDP